MITYDKEKQWQRLIGQHESMRLEFKSCRLFDNKRKGINDLSKEASAFANSEGGAILIGIEEKKEGKTRVADRLLGIDSEIIAPEWLQQIIESNISPYLPGIRVHRVPFSDGNAGKIGFAILIPRGTTAYQANDMKYYGRSEYEKKALPDHEIRLLMMKGRIAQATVLTGYSELITAEDHNLREKKRVEALRASKRIFRREDEVKEVDYDRYLIQLEVLNTSDITISNFAFEINLESSFLVKYKNKKRFRFPQSRSIYNTGTRDIWEPPELLFPRDRLQLPTEKLEFRVPVNQDFFSKKSVLHWKVFLDNAPPCNGSIDLRQVFAEKLKAEQAASQDTGGFLA